ncbi:hypothetical protein NCLIV_043730 [Neospora caninum Liverpool]|uniref:Uncharacterized protein n=1 Tax=Neospora caninum (strain Liverpool) TaxID=572307 RepID=F0VAP9_NEOCL|nr:hypothetical protein NCLIV_043730 [Neospora caninum Liverpool]CBZ51307.1 hypothetical protein NCLIV_043730 [Neospora caninum Liverpool]|eukprot:XP_003881340.1 hypothetical protein NCLIV_043730 [Neospora caninum Liverpool]
MLVETPVSIIDLETQVDRLISAIRGHSGKVAQGAHSAFANKAYACRLGFELAAAGATELVWSAICEYFHDEVNEQVHTVFGARDKSRGVTASSATASKNGCLPAPAARGESGEDGVLSAPRTSTSRKSTDMQLVTAVCLMVQLRTVVTFHRASKNDPHLYTAQSIREAADRLQECQHYLRAFVQLPCQDRESYYWIPLQCSIMVYRICRYLRTEHHGSLCRPCLAWVLSCLDASVPLLSPQYLRWKSSLALQIIRVSETEMAFDDASRVCTRMLGEVQKLELYERMEPPVPEEIRNILAHTRFLFTALSLKYQCWSEELPVSTAVETLQQLSRDFAAVYARETQDTDPFGPNVGRGRAPAAPATFAPSTLPLEDVHGSSYLPQRLVMTLLLEFASLDDGSQRLVDLSDWLPQAESLLPQYLPPSDRLSADTPSRVLRAEDLSAGPRAGVWPAGTADGSPNHAGGTGNAPQRKKKTAAASDVKEPTLSKETGATGYGLQSPAAEEAGKCVQFSLVDQCLTAAGGVLSDILSGTEKIDQLIQSVPLAEDPSWSGAVAAQSAVTDGLAKRGGSKKNRPSSHAPSAERGEISASPSLAATLAAVRAAQRAAMELPESIHVELFLLCFRFRNQLGERFQRLCRTLEARLRYRHFLNPPLVDLAVSSSTSGKLARRGSAAGSESNESPPWTVLSCDLLTFKQALPLGATGGVTSSTGTYLVGQRWDWERVLRSVARPCSAGESDEEAAAAEKLEVVRRELESVALICDLRPVWATSHEEAKKLYRKGNSGGSTDLEGDRAASAPVAGDLTAALEFDARRLLSDTVAGFRKHLVNEIDNGLIPSEVASLVALEIPLRKSQDRETTASRKPTQNLFLVYLRCSGRARPVRAGGNSGRETNFDPPGGFCGEKDATAPLEGSGHSLGKAESDWSEVIQWIDETASRDNWGRYEEDASLLRRWEGFLCSALGTVLRAMLTCGLQDANAIAQATYTLTRLLRARKEHRAARKHVRSAVAHVEEIVGSLMQQSGSGLDPCLTASLDPLPYLLEEETFREREKQETLLSPRASPGAVARTRRGAYISGSFASFEGDSQSNANDGEGEKYLGQEKKWGAFVLQSASLLVMLYDLSLKLDLELGEQPEREKALATSKERGMRTEDAAKAEQSHAEKLMRQQLQEMGNLDLSPLENHLLTKLGQNPYRLCLFWCRLSESRQVNAQQILTVAVRELESAVATERQLVHAGWLFQTDDPAAAPPTSRPPILLGRSCTSLSLSMPATRKNVMSQDAFVTLFGGKIAGSGISVTKLHTDLLHTGFRHPPQGIVHIPHLAPNTKYHFACEEHIDLRKSLALSETTPDFGTYYPLPIPLLWMHILSSAQKLGIKSITKICWEKLWSFFCEEKRVSPTAGGHTICHFKPFIAERQSPYVLDAFARAICAKYSHAPLASGRFSGPGRDTRRGQEKRQRRASRLLIAVEAASLARNYSCLFSAVAAYDAQLRPLLCLRTLPPLLLDGVVKCLVAMEGVPCTAWHPRGRALFGLLTSRLMLLQTQWLQVGGGDEWGDLKGQAAQEAEALAVYSALKTTCCVPQLTCPGLASRATFEETEMLLHSAVAAVVVGGERDVGSLRALLPEATEEDLHVAVLDLDAIRKVSSAEDAAKCALAVLDRLRTHALLRLPPPSLPSSSSCPSVSFPVAPYFYGLLMTLALRKCSRQWKGRPTLEFAWLIREARSLLLSAASRPNSASPSSRVEGGDANAARLSPLKGGGTSALQLPPASSAPALSLDRQLEAATDALARFFLDETEATGVVRCDPVEAVHPGGSDMHHLAAPWSSLDSYPVFLRLFASASPAPPLGERPQGPRACSPGGPAATAAPHASPLGSHKCRFLRDRPLQSEELRAALVASRESPLTLWLAEVELLAVRPLLQLLREATRRGRVPSWRSTQSPLPSTSWALSPGDAEEDAAPHASSPDPACSGEEALRQHRGTDASTLLRTGKESNPRLSRVSVRPDPADPPPRLAVGRPSQMAPSSIRDSDLSSPSSSPLSPSLARPGLAGRDRGGWSREAELRLVASVVGHLAQAALLASLAEAPQLLQLCLLSALNTLLCSVPSPREIVDFSLFLSQNDAAKQEDECALDAPPALGPPSAPPPNTLHVASTSANPPSSRFSSNPGAAGPAASPTDAALKEGKRGTPLAPCFLAAYLRTAGLASLLPYGRNQLREKALSPSDLASGVHLPPLFLQALGDKTAGGLSGGDRRDRTVRQAGDSGARNGSSLAPRAASGSGAAAGKVSGERSGKSSVRAKGKSVGGPGYSAFGTALSGAREGDEGSPPVDNGGARGRLERKPADSEGDSGERDREESPLPLWVAFGVLAQMCVDFLANHKSERARLSAPAGDAKSGGTASGRGNARLCAIEGDREEEREDQGHRTLQSDAEDVLAVASDREASDRRPIAGGAEEAPGRRQRETDATRQREATGVSPEGMPNRVSAISRERSPPWCGDWETAMQPTRDVRRGTRPGCKTRYDYFDAEKLPFEDIDLRSIGRLFIFCIQVLMLKSRWHQTVALCIRFNALTGNQFAFALSSYALAAQQHIVALHKAAVEESKEQMKKAEQELGSPQGDRRKTERRAAVVGPAHRQERLYFHRKKCYDAVLEGQVFAYSLTKAVEAQLRQERAEAGIYESSGETQLRAARLQLSRFWQQLLGPSSAGAVLDVAASCASQDPTHPLPPSSPALLSSSIDVSPSTGVFSASKASSCRPAGTEPNSPLKASAVLHAYCLAEGFLRRHQQADLLSLALFEKGNMLCISGKAALAAKAWREAVDAAHRQMDAVLQTECAESLRVGREPGDPCGDANGAAGSGCLHPETRTRTQPSACAKTCHRSAARISSPQVCSSPPSPRKALASKETKKPLVAGLASAVPTPQTGPPNGSQMRLALQSLVPLYFAARLGHFNSLDFHLASAALASQVVRRVLAASEPHPLDLARFFQYRSDGKCMRYRMREVGRLGALFEDALEVGGASMQSFLAALLWFAQILTDTQVEPVHAHALFALAEFLAADACKHVETATLCRARRATLLTSAGDLQAAFWQLVAIYQGQDTETMTGVFNRDCLDEMVEPQGSCGPLHLPPSPSPFAPASSACAGASEGFLNFAPVGHEQNARATATVLALNLPPQLEQLYGRDAAFFFALARAQWLFAADARMPVCLDAGGQRLAERLERLTALETFLLGLVKDILAEPEKQPQSPSLGDLPSAPPTSSRGPSRLITSPIGARHHGAGQSSGGNGSLSASTEEATASSLLGNLTLRDLHLISAGAWEVLLRSLLLLARVCGLRATPQQAASVLTFAIHLAQHRLDALRLDSALPCLLSPSPPAVHQTCGRGRRGTDGSSGVGDRSSGAEKGTSRETHAQESGEDAREHARCPAPPELNAGVVFPTPELNLQLFLHLAHATMQISDLDSAFALVERLLATCSGHALRPDLEASSRSLSPSLGSLSPASSTLSGLSTKPSVSDCSVRFSASPESPSSSPGSPFAFPLPPPLERRKVETVCAPLAVVDLLLLQADMLLLKGSLPEAFQAAVRALDYAERLRLHKSLQYVKACEKVYLLLTANPALGSLLDAPVSRKSLQRGKTPRAASSPEPTEPFPEGGCEASLPHSQACAWARRDAPSGFSPEAAVKQAPAASRSFASASPVRSRGDGAGRERQEAGTGGSSCAEGSSFFRSVSGGLGRVSRREWRGEGDGELGQGQERRLGHPTGVRRLGLVASPSLTTRFGPQPRERQGNARTAVRTLPLSKKAKDLARQTGKTGPDSFALCPVACATGSAYFSHLAVLQNLLINAIERLDEGAPGEEGDACGDRAENPAPAARETVSGSNGDKRVASETADQPDSAGECGGNGQAATAAAAPELERWPRDSLRFNGVGIAPSSFGADLDAAVIVSLVAAVSPKEIVGWPSSASLAFLPGFSVEVPAESLLSPLRAFISEILPLSLRVAETPTPYPSFLTLLSGDARSPLAFPRPAPAPGSGPAPQGPSPPVAARAPEPNLYAPQQELRLQLAVELVDVLLKKGDYMHAGLLVSDLVPRVRRIAAVLPFLAARLGLLHLRTRRLGTDLARMERHILRSGDPSLRSPSPPALRPSEQSSQNTHWLHQLGKYVGSVLTLSAFIETLCGHDFALLLSLYQEGIRGLLTYFLLEEGCKSAAARRGAFMAIHALRAAAEETMGLQKKALKGALVASLAPSGTEKSGQTGAAGAGHRTVPLAVSTMAGETQAKDGDRGDRGAAALDAGKLSPAAIKYLAALAANEAEGPGSCVSTAPNADLKVALPSILACLSSLRDRCTLFHSFNREQRAAADYLHMLLFCHAPRYRSLACLSPNAFLLSGAAAASSDASSSTHPTKNSVRTPSPSSRTGAASSSSASVSLASLFAPQTGSRSADAPWTALMNSTWRLGWCWLPSAPFDASESAVFDPTTRQWTLCSPPRGADAVTLLVCSRGKKLRSLPNSPGSLAASGDGGRESRLPASDGGRGGKGEKPERTGPASLSPQSQSSSILSPTSRENGTNSPGNGATRSPAASAAQLTEAPGSPGRAGGVTVGKPSKADSGRRGASTGRGEEDGNRGGSPEENGAEGTVYMGQYSHRRLLDMSMLFKKLCRQVRRGGNVGSLTRSQALELSGAQVLREVDRRQAWAVEDNLVSYRIISNAFYRLFLLLNDGLVPRTVAGDAEGGGPYHARRRAWIEGPAGTVFSSTTGRLGASGDSSLGSSSPSFRSSTAARPSLWRNRSSDGSSAQGSSLGASYALHSFSSPVFFGSRRGVWGAEETSAPQSRGGALEFLQDLDHGDIVRAHASRRSYAIKAVYRLWNDMRVVTQEQAAATQAPGAANEQGKATKINKRVGSAAQLAGSQTGHSGASSETGVSPPDRKSQGYVVEGVSNDVLYGVLLACADLANPVHVASTCGKESINRFFVDALAPCVVASVGDNDSSA